ncbi:hypothetical protein HK104_007014 [Borealophlyctis nickersoniae]|nr:hypothetical protein HK104_007014 [Borealophlyctis nickersoniae]
MISTQTKPALSVLVGRVQLHDFDFRDAVHRGRALLKTFLETHNLSSHLSTESAGVGVVPDNPRGPSPVYYETGYILSSPIPAGLADTITDLGKGKDEGVYVREIPAGKWVVRVVKGSYEQLGGAWGEVMKHIEENGLEKDGARPAYEVYVNDWKVVKEEELVTEVHVPIK